MRGIGEGPNAYRVDVVVRLDGEDPALDEGVLAMINAALTDDAAEDFGLPGVRPTCSYDMDAPDGTIGASMWVRAATPGAAVDAGVAAVDLALRELCGRGLPLWDVRALPATAVLPREDV